MFVCGAAGALGTARTLTGGAIELLAVGIGAANVKGTDGLAPGVAGLEPTGSVELAI